MLILAFRGEADAVLMASAKIVMIIVKERMRALLSDSADKLPIDRIIKFDPPINPELNYLA